jgi:3-keto-5-aminohexanoate cleavage enzyme
VGRPPDDRNPPITYDELYDDTRHCWDAGATAIHVHNSNFDLLGQASFDDGLKVCDRILKAPPAPTPW